MTEYKLIEDELIGKKYKPGNVFKIFINIPQIEQDEYALLVEHDSYNQKNNESIMALADEGKAPYTICVGVRPAYLANKDGSILREMRINTYDQYNSEYADFLVYELIPYITEKYNLKISNNPDMHMISGASSGGISAVTVAWYHSEFFHRVYCSSPSFLSMARGHELPFIIRKSETKPLKVYEERCEYECNDYFGSSFPTGIQFADAMIFCKYDFKVKYFPDEVHCSRYADYAEALERNEWIWKNWKTEPIVVKENSRRVENIVAFNEKWTEVDSMPKDDKKSTCDNYDIVLDAIDGQIKYAANKGERYVYLFAPGYELKKENQLIQAMVEGVPCFESGLIDMSIDGCDRIYILTTLGVQCVRSFGLIDVILDLPDNSTPLEIAVTDALYVKTEKGIYKRNIKNAGLNIRKNVHYFDD